MDPGRYGRRSAGVQTRLALNAEASAFRLVRRRGEKGYNTGLFRVTGIKILLLGPHMVHHIDRIIQPLASGLRIRLERSVF
jgi:hypothetical protein